VLRSRAGLHVLPTDALEGDGGSGRGGGTEGERAR
jgi:hypothetical protein